MKSPATSPRFSVRTNDSARGNDSARSNDYARSFCPRCDDVMVAPARSQHVKEDVIRHHWRCESCGHQFRTSVRLSFICVEAVRQVAVA
jgi:RNase P subunit RPR2